MYCMGDIIYIAPRFSIVNLTISMFNFKACSYQISDIWSFWILFFLLIYWCWSRGFWTGKAWYLYFSAHFIICCIYYGHQYFPKEAKDLVFTGILLSIFPICSYGQMSTVYWFVTDKISTEQLMKEKENENLKTELSFLRSQVSPHFLFNVLNNMCHGASQIWSAGALAHRLSGLMRYMLYESDEISWPCSGKRIRKYLYRVARNPLCKILIHQSRYGPGNNQLIEPMLLIPFKKMLLNMEPERLTILLLKSHWKFQRDWLISR